MRSLGAGHELAGRLDSPCRRGRRAKVSVSGYLRQLSVLAFFFGFGLILSPLCRLLYFVAGSRISPEWGQRLLHRTFRTFIRWMQWTGTLELDAAGMEKLASLRGTIITANHPGLLDAIFLLNFLPRAACVMRAGLLENPVMSGAALLAGYLRNDSGAELVRDGIRTLGTGGNLLIFPEGTRTDGSGVNAFKHGFAMMAVRTGRPVQTVLIEQSGDYLRKGVSLWAPCDLPIRVRLRPGEIFVPEPGESARAFSKRMEEWFRTRLEGPAE